MLLTLTISLGMSLAVTAVAADAPAKKPTMQQVLDASKASDWRPLDADNTLYMELPGGRVVIELNKDFAPLHAANIRTLVKQKYFDGLAVLRVVDNFVTQWGDPNAEDEGKARSLGKAKASLAPEFSRPAKDLAFTPLPDGDVYAPEVGFSNGFPAARDPKTGQAWLTHCYGMVGAGRGNEAESGSGAELYVVIGQAPRQLDLNIATVGRVVQGMELLAALPRGNGPGGFYENDQEKLPITSIRLAADVAQKDRSHLQILRTDTPTFTALVESRRNRSDDWYLKPAGKIGLCNVPIPVREQKVDM
ncbi:MAG TPA: peptidylprolyl isomerase [Dokdonella sp.]|nr:peptidylprolyl isomerase [Dokdonella sp.]HET9034358.1 peptidylprolyl isomerase [Dokdonella sp.]